jgi:hypothetical protein
MFRKWFLFDSGLAAPRQGNLRMNERVLCPRIRYPAGPAAAARVTRSPRSAVVPLPALTHRPGGEYPAEDLAKDKAPCAIDFQGTSHGLCPRVFTTSPATP